MNVSVRATPYTTYIRVFLPSYEGRFYFDNMSDSSYLTFFMCLPQLNPMAGKS